MMDKLQYIRELSMKVLPVMMGVLFLVLVAIDPNAPAASITLVAYAMVLVGAGGLAFWAPRLGYFILGPIAACGMLATDNWDWRGEAMLPAAMILGVYWLYAWTEKSRVKKL